MSIEYELKFSASLDAQAAIAAVWGEPGAVLAMETTYYDTLDHALSARHWTLRRRLENNVSVCTLKTPAGKARNEWECEADSIEAGIAELCKLSDSEELASLTKNGVIPSCGARFTRRAYTLRHQNAVLELALDTGVLMGGGRELPLCEVEVELKAGEAQAAEDFAQALAKRFGLTPQPKSKFRRALDLVKGEA